MPYFTEDPEQYKNAQIVGIECDLVWRDLPLSDFVNDLAKRYPDDPDSEDERDHDGMQTFTVCSISRVEEPFGLWVYCHAHIQKGWLSYFRIDLDRKPKQPVPDEFLKISRELGDFPSGFEKLVEGIGPVAGPCAATATLLYPKSPFKLGMNPSLPDIAPFKRERENVNFSGPHGVEAEISLFEDGAAMLEVSQKIQLTLTVDSFEEACKLLTGSASPLWKPA